MRFDGIRFRKPDGETALAVFRAEQVKSAIGNRGTFDPADPNILNQSALSPTDAAMRKWRDALGRVSRDQLDYVPRLDTPAVLRAMGIRTAKLDFPTRYILAIHEKHPDVPLGVFETLPALLSDPLFVIPHKDGGVRVFVDANAENGDPIAVGIGDDGRVHTVTPINASADLTGEQRVQEAVAKAVRGSKRVYARNKEAIVKTMASAVASPGTIPLQRSSISAANIVTRDSLVKRVGGEFYQTSQQQGPRGSFSPATNTVTLLKNADLSTFLHESAHYFFEADTALASELVAEARGRGYDMLKPGERQIIDDVSRLLAWHGIQGDIEEQLRQWHTMDFEEQRSHHERTAESFEAYLFSGQAPSLELQPYFRRFRAWLIDVYKSLKDFLTRNPEAGKLNDEVRGVFDRMLASNEQIQLAEQGRSMMPLFSSPEQAGMTPEVSIRARP